MKSSPSSLQLEKAQVWQWKLNATKKKRKETGKKPRDEGIRGTTGDTILVRFKMEHYVQTWTPNSKKETIETM